MWEAMNIRDISLVIQFLSATFLHTICCPHGQVSAGLECGIVVEGFNEWVEGDVLEAFNTVQKRRTLEEASASMAAALEKVGIKL